MSDLKFFEEKYEYHPDGYLISRATKKQVGKPNEEGYIRIRGSNGKEYRAHRIIWSLHNGEIPEGMLIDHIDGNKQNNKIDNLRLATRTQNNNNSIGRSVRGYPKGVQPTSSGKYRARIMQNGKQICIGTYDTVEEAKFSYDIKAIEIQGEFAKL
jgi:hypothetical protein